jgi:hypothetical protein
MSSPEQQEVELETVEVEHNIKMGEALERLEQNADFKTIINEGYLDQAVKNSVSLLALPARQLDAITAGGGRVSVMENLVAASNLQYYLAMLKQFHQSAIAPDTFEEDEAEEAIDKDLH